MAKATDNTGPFVYVGEGLTAGRTGRRYWRDTGALQATFSSGQALQGMLAKADGSIVHHYSNSVQRVRGDNPNTVLNQQVVDTASITPIGNPDTGETFFRHSSGVGAFVRKLTDAFGTAWTYTEDDLAAGNRVFLTPDGSWGYELTAPGANGSWRVRTNAGAIKWTTERPFAQSFVCPDSPDAYIYFEEEYIAARWRLRRLDPDTGVIDPGWSFDPAPVGGGVTGRLSITASGRYVQMHRPGGASTQPYLRVFDATGTLVWDHYALGVTLPGSVSGNLYYSDEDDDGHVYWRNTDINVGGTPRFGKVNGATGATLWTVSTTDQIWYVRVDRMHGARLEIAYPDRELYGTSTFLAALIPGVFDLDARVVHLSPGVTLTSVMLSAGNGPTTPISGPIAGAYDAESDVYRAELDLTGYEGANSYLMVDGTVDQGYIYGVNASFTTNYHFVPNALALPYRAGYRFWTQRRDYGAVSGWSERPRQDPDDDASIFAEYEPVSADVYRTGWLYFLHSKEALPLSDVADSQVVRVRMKRVGDFALDPPIVIPTLEVRQVDGTYAATSVLASVTVTSETGAVYEIPFRAADLDPPPDAEFPNRLARSVRLKLVATLDSIPRAAAVVDRTARDGAFYLPEFENVDSFVTQDPDALPTTFNTSTKGVAQHFRVQFQDGLPADWPTHLLDPVATHTLRWRLRKNGSNAPTIYEMRIGGGYYNDAEDGEQAFLLSLTEAVFPMALLIDAADPGAIYAFDFTLGDLLDANGDPLTASTRVYFLYLDFFSNPGSGGGGPSNQGTVEVAGAELRVSQPAYSETPSGLGIAGVRWSPVTDTGPGGTVIDAEVNMVGAGAAVLGGVRGRRGSLEAAGTSGLALAARSGARASLTATAALALVGTVAAPATAKLTARATFTAAPGAMLLAGRAALFARASLTARLGFEEWSAEDLFGDAADPNVGTLLALRPRQGYFTARTVAYVSSIDFGKRVRIVSTEGVGLADRARVDRLIRTYERGEVFVVGPVVIDDDIGPALYYASFDPEVEPMFVPVEPGGNYYAVDFVVRLRLVGTWGDVFDPIPDPELPQHSPPVDPSPLYPPLAEYVAGVPPVLVEVAASAGTDPRRIYVDRTTPVPLHLQTDAWFLLADHSFDHANTKNLDLGPTSAFRVDPARRMREDVFELPRPSSQPWSWDQHGYVDYDGSKPRFFLGGLGGNLGEENVLSLPDKHGFTAKLQYTYNVPGVRIRSIIFSLAWFGAGFHADFTPGALTQMERNWWSQPAAGLAGRAPEQPIVTGSIGSGAVSVYASHSLYLDAGKYDHRYGLVPASDNPFHLSAGNAMVPASSYANLFVDCRAERVHARVALAGRNLEMVDEALNVASFAAPSVTPPAGSYTIVRVVAFKGTAAITDFASIAGYDIADFRYHYWEQYIDPEYNIPRSRLVVDTLAALKLGAESLVRWVPRAPTEDGQTIREIDRRPAGGTIGVAIMHRQVTVNGSEAIGGAFGAGNVTSAGTVTPLLSYVAALRADPWDPAE